MINFIYDDKSSEDFNIVVKSIKGRYDTPERDIETIEISGRDGALYVDNESYKTKKIEIEFYIKDRIGIYANKIDSWLYNKFQIKKLFFDDEPYLYYEAICINKISFSEVFRNFNECRVVFECQPFKRLFDGENIIKVLNSNSVVHNTTSYTSKPYLKLIGNGDITLYINNKSYLFRDVEEFIEIDSEYMNCYKTINGVLEYQNSKMYTPTFPLLEAEENIISWVGQVEAIEIKPRWCII